MSSLSASAAIFRRGGYTFTGYISTPPETSVLGGTITAVPTYPATSLAYTLTSGASASALGDLTIHFYSSGGTKKATLRVATGATTTNTVLYVNEFSQGVYDVAVNDTFTVVKTWSIWDRLVSATASLNKDSRIAYSDQGSNPNPVCNSGGANAGESTTRNFYGATSFTIDPDSSGTLTHAWDFGDGTPSTDTVAAPTGVSFPVGFRWVKHTVTDTGNSKTAVQYVPTFVHGTGYEALAVQMDMLSASVEQGWRCSFKLPRGTEGSITNLPDGALIVYWEREKYNGTETSYGSNVDNRSNVKFVGYLVSDSIHIEPDSNEVTFEAVSPLAILEQTPALPQLMVSATSPAKWSELKTLSTKKMFWYLSYWHSSLQDVFDFVWNDGTDITYERIAVEGQTIAEQLRDIGNGLNIQVTCDRLGRILFTRDPAYLTTAERSARTTTYNLTTADIMEVDLTRNHRGSVKLVRGEGITNSNEPVFSNAPGNAPASFGVGTDTLPKQIVTSQTMLNTRTGYYFAKINGLYNGQFKPKGARVKLPDGYDVFDPALREFVTLELASSYTSRAVGWENTARWTLEGVDISYDLERGAKEISLTIDHETAGATGVTYIPPQDGQSGFPEFPPLDITFPDLGTDPDTGLGIDPGGAVGGVTSPSSVNMAVFCSDNKVYLTANFETPEAAGGPTWTSTDLTGLANWEGGTLLAFCADPYSASYLGTGDDVDGWICTTTHVQKVTDIFGTIALGTAFEFSDECYNRTMSFERATQNFGVVASYYDAAGVSATVTTDGTSWTETVITAHDNTESTGVAPGVWISPTTSGKAYISVFTATGDDSTAEAKFYKTTNSGGSWSLLTSPPVDTGAETSSFIKVPFGNSGTTVYHRKNDSGITLNRIVSSTETDITPEEATLPYLPIGQYANELAIAESDPNTLGYIGFTGAAGTWSEDFNFLLDTGGFAPRVECGANEAVWTTGVGWEDIVDAPYDGGGGDCTNWSTRNVITLTFPPTTLTDILLTYDYTAGSIYTTDDRQVKVLIGADLGSLTTVINGDETTGTGKTASWSGSQEVGAIMINIWSSGGKNDTPGTDGSSTITALELDGADGNPFDIQYGFFVTNNATSTTPTWTTVDTGGSDDVPYRQVFALSASTFLLLGTNGAIGISDGTSINSRIGNISTTGTMLGSCAI